MRLPRYPVLVAAFAICAATVQAHADTGVFRSISGNGDLCITVPDKPDLDRRFVTLEACGDTERQKFTYSGRIGRVRYGDFCLHAFEGGSKGALVGLRKCQRTRTQVWAVRDCPPNAVCPMVVSDKDPILVNWQQNLCLRPVAQATPGSRLELRECQLPTANLDRWRVPGHPPRAQPIVRIPADPPRPRFGSFRQRWHWECITEKFMQCCSAFHNFVVRPGTKLCRYEITNNSVSPRSIEQNTRVTEIGGGIYIERSTDPATEPASICGSFTGERAWFDSHVLVVTTDPALPESDRQSLGCTVPPGPPPDAPSTGMQIGWFCIKRGLPNGWIATGRQSNPACSSRGDEPFEQNEWKAVYLPPLPKGFILSVCSVGGVPAGWRDLGTYSGGNCERSPLGPTYHDMRRIEKL